MNQTSSWKEKVRGWAASGDGVILDSYFPRFPSLRRPQTHQLDSIPRVSPCSGHHSEIPPSLGASAESWCWEGAAGEVTQLFSITDIKNLIWWLGLWLS